MANPVLSERAFSTVDNSLETSVMSAGGTITKTVILGLLTALTFSYTWFLQINNFSDKASLLYLAGFIGIIVLSIIIVWGPKNRSLAITTPLYALCEGLVLGSLSAIINSFYPGVASQAALATIATVLFMAFSYKTKIIQCTEVVRSTVIIATLSIGAIYLLQIILSFFHIVIPGLYSNSLFGIGVSVVFTIVAALNLILDFDFIERFSGQVPKYYEWYGAFALLVTIIWIYIEMLKLLAKISSRR